MVAAEQTGIFNTGGLGHTVSGLARALKRDGKAIDVVMPFYSDIDVSIKERVVRERMLPIEFRWGDFPGAHEFRFEIFSVTDSESGLKTFLLKDTSNTDIFENTPPEKAAKRYTNYQSEGMAFAVFNRAAATFISQRNYNIVNLHDWHSGYVGHFLKKMDTSAQKDISQRRVLFTISNFGYQGVFEIGSLGGGQPGPEEYVPEKYEFYGKSNFMKAGIIDADWVLTVSKNYLREIFLPRYSGGLDGFLAVESKRRPFTAITNGADLKQWTPVDFSSSDFSGKAKGKFELLREVGLGERAAEPLYVMTSRLANQKGMDYLPRAFEMFFAEKNVGTLIITGDGEPRYEQEVRKLAQKFPDRVAYRKFSSTLEKKCTFYGDFFVNGAWYEPSGTNQMFALKSGTIPILSRVGGLPEYIQERKTGYLVNLEYEQKDIHIEKTARSFAKVIGETSVVYRQSPNTHKAMMSDAMKVDHSWDQRISEYASLFSSLKKSPSVLAKGQYQCHDLEVGSVAR